MLFILIIKKTYNLVYMGTNDIIPGKFIGRQMSDLFLCAGPSLVFARRHIQSAWAPLVIHIFPPLIM